MIIASTGQSSTAISTESSKFAGTSSAMTSAMSSPILKTSGHVSAHKPQAVQVSSILTFIVIPHF